MLTKQMAEKAIEVKFPYSTIRAGVEFEDKYFFVVYIDNDPESFFDPFYSVDKNSGEVLEFSMTSDPNANVVIDLLNKTFIKENAGVHE